MGVSEIGDIGSIKYGICNMDIMSLFHSICEPREVSIQDRITSHHQLHNKILGCMRWIPELWNPRLSCVKFGRRDEQSTPVVCHPEESCEDQPR